MSGQTPRPPYMKRNAASGFWPVRTPQEKYGPHEDRNGKCVRDGRDWPCAAAILGPPPCPHTLGPDERCQPCIDFYDTPFWSSDDTQSTEGGQPTDHASSQPPPDAVCAWCGRAIALSDRPTLDGQEWFCSRECDEACDPAPPASSPMGQHP